MEIQSVVLDKLEQLEKLITTSNLLQKPVLNFQEASQYLEISPSHLYKLTSKRAVPHFCPNGKKLYFKREELDQWLLRNKKLSTDEVEEKTESYLSRKGQQK
jgi:excisionase family DNA binding protein